MTLPVALRRPLRSAAGLRTSADSEQSALRRVRLAWAMLLLNTLTFYPKTWSNQPLIVPIPSSAGKVITQGALGVALLLALSVNRRLVIRPNVFLCLVTLLVAETLISAGQAEHVGTVYRTFRLGAFVVTMWLLSPWFGRRDLILVRAHLVAAFAVLGSVLLGLLIAPHTARAEGRLAGAFWPTPPTQVAEFAAVVIGIVTVLWLGGAYPGRRTLAIVAVAGTILLLTHTRTALLAMLIGLVVAGFSLFTARARKTLGWAAAAGSVAAITLSGLATNWLTRGESAAELSDLTGRTPVWTGVLSTPRDRFQDLFGFGLSNKSFNGLPIDSNWLACYFDEGLAGLVISGTIVLYLLIAALIRPRCVERSLALFLITYCIAASFTEVGFSDASTYLLYLTLAASLLVPPESQGGNA